MQALILAAGMGNRLGKLTSDNTKCMVEVAGVKLVDRAIEAIRYAGIKKIIFVIGYKGEKLKKYILDNYFDSDIEFVFIFNKDYATSNNIYSFYLAKDQMFLDDTILLESDLIYDVTLIDKIVKCKDRNLAVVAKYQSWMDGTVVTVDKNNYIDQFIEKKEMDLSLTDSYYKTVNVYKFSKEFFKRFYLPFLEAYMKVYGLNSYYETVLKVLSQVSKTGLKALYMGDLPWYEIDDFQDLDIANVLFEKGKAKYNDITLKFGGYWRYGKILDFCYLVNPYFPQKGMVEKLKKEFSILLTQYPSGLSIQNMNASRIFKVDLENILVGNGAAELINVLGEYLTGKVAVALPTFNEYVRCFRNCTLIKIDNSKWDYKHNLDELKRQTKEVDTLMIVNPDNPSGYLIDKDDVLSLASEAKKNNCRLVVDESFVDFAKNERRYTLLDDEILKEYDNLVVLKSISKSYGVPGLRLGVLASFDKTLIAFLRARMQVWNINSFAEYYLQIYNLYASDYLSACNCIVKERERMIGELREINGIKVYDSEANYIMVYLGDRSSYDFCVKMLDEYNILIKDLSSKNYFIGKNFVRIAVRDSYDNDILISAVKKEFNNENN